MTGQTIKNHLNNVAISALGDTIQKLVDADITVYVIHTVPTADFDPPRRLALQEMFNSDQLDKIQIGLNPYLEQKAGIDIIAQKFHIVKAVKFLDPQKFLCDTQFCRVSSNGKSLYYNSGHISVHGATFLEPMLESAIRHLQ